MNFLTDSELFADLDENGQFTKKAKTDDTLGSRYPGAIRTGANIVRYNGCSIPGKKAWKDDNKEWLYKVWEWGDSQIESILSKKKKGITIGAFPPVVVSTGKKSQQMRERWSAYSGSSDKQVLHTAELKVDYFENLSECVSRLGTQGGDTHSLRGYFEDILKSRDALSELTENYISMKKVCRWILFAMIWTLLCISSTIPGIPPFVPGVVQTVAGKIGGNVTYILLIAPLVLQILVSFFRCGGVAEDYSLLFWLVFPVVPITTGLCGAVGVMSGVKLSESFDDILTWILAGIYLFWLLILLLVVLYVRHVEGKKRKEQPALRKAFVKAVDANAEKIHRYIRLRVLWWKHLNGSRSLPYGLTDLQKLFDKCVMEADKYRCMK